MKTKIPFEIWPRKAVPKKGSHILELADGSEDSRCEDDDDDDRPTVDGSDFDSDSDEEKSDKEAPAESAEAELSMC